MKGIVTEAAWNWWNGVNDLCQCTWLNSTTLYFQRRCKRANLIDRLHLIKDKVNVTDLRGLLFNKRLQLKQRVSNVNGVILIYHKHIWRSAPNDKGQYIYLYSFAMLNG